MKHYLFVNKYYSTLYVKDKEIRRECFNINGMKTFEFQNSCQLDIEKEKYVVTPFYSCFENGFEHFFSIDEMFGKEYSKALFIIDFLEQVFRCIDDLDDIVVILSFGAVGDNINIKFFKDILENYILNVKIEILIKDILFIGALTFLSLVQKKSYTLVSGFNITSTIQDKKNLIRKYNTIWVDKQETLENIKYYQECADLQSDKEIQKVFDLALDNVLNYGNKQFYYETRDHRYKVPTNIINDYVEELKKNIKDTIRSDTFYLFDIPFPLIYDEYVKILGIDIDKENEILEFYKYVIEYTDIILEHNTAYKRIMMKKNNLLSLTDGYHEYDLENLVNKNINDLLKLFNNKYVKRSNVYVK